MSQSCVEKRLVSPGTRGQTSGGGEPLRPVSQRAGRTETFETPLVLTRTEFVLLEYLMHRAGRVVSRDDLIEAVWGIDRDVERNTVDVFIFQLRSKIEGGGGSRLLQTVRGFGYTIRETED